MGAFEKAPEAPASGLKNAGEKASILSAEAAVAVRPFKTYRALAAHRNERTWADLGRALVLEGVFLGAMVSFTTAGRLVITHVVLTAVFWGFLPLLQIGAVVAAARVVAPNEKPIATASLYFEGLGPYYVFYLVLSAICLFSPHVYTTFTALLRVGALPLYLLGTVLWGMVVTWAFWREALGLSRGRAALGCGVFYSIFVGTIVGWYLAMNEIQPQIVGTSS
ncbi:MAG: hypothetical protein IPK82_10920 [Polyangiaceae bacterium]|nr:hypothetical protein [Polyangiaceae bacterium]